MTRLPPLAALAALSLLLAACGGGNGSDAPAASTSQRLMPATRFTLVMRAGDSVQTHKGVIRSVDASARAVCFTDPEPSADFHTTPTKGC